MLQAPPVLQAPPMLQAGPVMQDAECSADVSGRCVGEMRQEGHRLHEDLISITKTAGEQRLLDGRLAFCLECGQHAVGSAVRHGALSALRLVCVIRVRNLSSTGLVMSKVASRLAKAGGDRCPLPFA